MTEWTQQQREAVYRRGVSIVLSAGAGSGKTFVLTQRYISHLELDGATPRQLVAITFTERAAREMRERIRHTLRQRLQQARQVHDPDTARRWQLHLRELEQATITTIHAFCNALLRRHAVAAGLDPSFTVLDELQAATFRQEQIAESLRRLLLQPSSPPESLSLQYLLTYYSYAEIQRHIEGLVSQYDRSRWEHWLGQTPDELATFWHEQARQLQPRWVVHLRRTHAAWVALESFLPRLRAAGLTLSCLADELEQQLNALPHTTDWTAALERLRQTATIRAIPQKSWPDDTLRERARKIFEDFRESLKNGSELFDNLHWQQEGITAAAILSQHWLHVAAWVANDYQRRKNEQDLLDFHDLLTRCCDLLQRDERIRTELQQLYRFILVDELQDTDPVQMELLRLLCGEQLTSGKLFAVGDHKQSIYRFRGADVHLFLDLRRQMPPEGQLDLSRNFRSHPGILRFVNALFCRHLEEYVPLEAHRLTDNAHEVPVEFLWVVPEQQADDVELVHQEEEGAALFRRRREARAIAQRIQQLLDDPTPRRWGRDPQPRRLCPRDIAILFRSMSHVDVYEAALQQAGIDYYLVGGWAFFAQQEIYDLLNVLRAVENPHDWISLAGALRSPFFQLSDATLVILAQHRDGLVAGLNDPALRAQLPPEQQEAVERAARLLSHWQKAKDRLPIARLLQKIIGESAYDAALQFEPLGPRKLANLWKIVEMARDFECRGLFGLHEFAQRLHDLVARQPKEEQAATVPEQADVVRLMSIHQAKGLEFPVVVVPDLAGTRRSGLAFPVRWHQVLGLLTDLPAEWKTASAQEETPPFSPLPFQLGQRLDQIDETAEEWRVLYVACTRAADRLILSTGLDQTPEPDDPLLPLPHNPWTLLLHERFDLEQGICRDPATPCQVAVRWVTPSLSEV
ncbi:MAG: UvrD-helicase domain-containing protein [Gemmataceae bacterium]|nr:UvrD-helicase domain-containing protein [Gemmataceae bacterium]MDW8243120.1 UvrD-helicase domain-containing protein [Thermogemmata sp.]